GSRAYDDAFAAAPQLEISSRACPRFVEFVEAGVTSGDELFAVAEEYLAPLREGGVDTLVLGCTHYPLMSAAIQRVMGENVTLVSSAQETASDVYNLLVEHGLEHDPATPHSYEFEATGDDRTGNSKADFIRLARRFLGPEVISVERLETGVIPLPTKGLS
ncbi:MAG: glutamate racemase, partial [Lacisediminihabitans sp.]